MKNLTVYHGTGHYSLNEILLEGPIFRRRQYHRPKKSFCTTTEFSVAERFAVRHTPADDFLSGKISGLVLEFEVCGKEGVDFEPVRDFSSMQEESEIAVYNRRKLKLVAIWRHQKEWIRGTA
jgi:hypothetical protein